MEQRHTFSEIMLQLAIAAIACMLFNIPDQAKDGIPVTMYLMLFGFALVSYAAERLFLREPKSFAVAAVFSAALFLAGFGAAAAIGLVNSPAVGIFLGIIFLLLTGMAFRATTKGININQLTLCFDALVVLLLIYILFIEMETGKLPAALPGAVGTAAAFAGIMTLREGTRISGKDRLFSTLIILAIVAVAFLVYLLFADPLRAGFAGIFSGIGAALAWIGSLLKKILLFFSNLFPQEQYEAVEGDSGGGISMPGGEIGEEEALSPVPFLILGGILVIAAIVVVILVCRKRRFSGKTIAKVARTASVKRDHVSLWKALQIWVKEKLYRLKVRIFFLKNRNTPAGRFYRLVRSLKHTGHALQPGETPKEFLQRYIAGLQPDDKRIPELNDLIEELNLQLYRPS